MPSHFTPVEKTRIVFDVDGVLLNFLQTISNYIETSYNLKTSIPYATSQWTLKKRFNKEEIEAIGFDNIKLAFEKAGLWKSLEPMPEIELMKEIVHNPMFEIFFVTSIPSHLHEDRKHNLNALLKINIDDDHLICLDPSLSKKASIEALKPDYFIEDSFKNLQDCHIDQAHTSIWIDLNENVYDMSRAHEYDFITVKSLNEALKHIRAQTYTLHDTNRLIEQVQGVLSHDLLSGNYAKVKRDSFTEGHCYASSEAMFHMMGGAHAGLSACVASFEKNGEKMTHWWLKNKDGEIIDPTADQFYAVGATPPYEAGHATGFLTKAPSKRAQEIIKRLTGDSLVPEVNSSDSDDNLQKKVTKKSKNRTL
jgi:hypothetical protein